MHSSSRNGEHGWWTDFFTDFRPFFGIVPRKATNALVRYLVRNLRLQPGHRFLDCPCGIGRIALPLARQGIRVTGVDITQEYLEETAAKARRQHLKIELMHADMRHIKFKNRFHAAANLWTSFGYFGSESDDLRVLRRMFEALRTGGRFMLHTINRDWILKNFQPTDWTECAGVRVLEQRRFDYATSIMHATWRFVRPEGESCHDTIIRMYSFHELVALFRRTGFVDVEGCGNEQGEPVSADQRMLFVTGSKPR
jgi:ubiquinone/menaquinone biosynthesis C-methylase UbiE